jgi:hypothetical protein
MTSLTTVCATSDIGKPLRPPSKGAKSLCAVVSVVISLSLLGSVAVGITMPTTVASALADAGSA